MNERDPAGISNVDRILLQTTGAFLRRLRQRLLLIILIAVVPILAFIVYERELARDLQIAEAQEAAWRIVENVALRESRFIDSVQQLLVLLAQTPGLGDTHSGCNALLGRLRQQDQDHISFGVADSDGAVRCRTGAADATDGTDQREIFARAAKAKAFVIGDYQGQPGRRAKSIQFAVPNMADHDQVASVVFATIDVSWIAQLGSESNLPRGVALSIVDSKGTLLARFPGNEQWVGKHIPDGSLFEILQLRSQVSRELIGLDGIDRLYALKPVSVRAGDGQIYVMVGIPKTVAFGEVNRGLARSLAWLAIIALSASALAWLIGSKFVVGYVKRRAEAEEARLRLAAIVESAEDAIIGLTLEGKITSWNDGAESMYGFTAREMIGNSVYRLIPESHQNEVEELLAIVKNGRGLNRYESKRIRKNHQLFDISASLSPVRDLHGRVVGAATIMRDVTLARRGEDQLLAYTDQLETLNLISHEIAGTLSVAEVVERSLNRLVAANRFEVGFACLAEEVSGRKLYAASGQSQPLAELEQLWNRLGRDFEECVWQCRNPWFVEDTAAAPEFTAAESNNPVKSLAVLPLTDGGRLRAILVLMNLRAHVFGADEKQFLNAVCREVALALENARLYGATVKMNEELRREVEERKRAEQTLADFTAMVAHDLRSPLSNVVSITDSVRGGLFGPVNELQQKWLWKIQQSCQSLIGQVSDFLDISKIDAGQFQLIKTVVDVGALLHDILAEYSVEAGKREITLKNEISEPLPRLLLDRRCMHQVLENLLSNALKFTPAGGQIEVAARSCSEAQVVLSVKDSGTGIPPEELELVFDKYRQVRGGARNLEKGTGLGLAICKRLLEAHGGRIWVESELGHGSVFFISLPLDSPESACATPA